MSNVQQPCTDETKQPAHDQFVDQNEEREILQAVTQQGISVEAARSALAQVCTTKDFLVESQILARAKKVLETFAENGGGISHKEFNDAVALCQKECQGRRDEEECKTMIIEIIEANHYPIRQGLFNHWYAKVKKEAGRS